MSDLAYEYGKIEKKLNTNDLLKKKSLKFNNKNNETIQCQDGFFCPDENTCCEMKNGHFGCCPMPKVSFLFYYTTK